MTYEEQKLEELYTQYFHGTKDEGNFSRACLTADKICAKVYNENGICAQYECMPLFEQSWIGSVIDNEHDMSTFWYLASQRHQKKVDQEKIAKKRQEGFVPASEVVEQLMKDGVRWNVYMDEGIMSSYVDVRTKHFGNGDVWAIIKGKRKCGWSIDSIVSNDYLVKIY